MDSTKKIVHTDIVCRIESNYNRVDKINNVKEAKDTTTEPKKVGLPTLVKNKKCAKEIKKAGLHPIGIKSSEILLKILCITAIALIQVASSSSPLSPCTGLPSAATNTRHKQALAYTISGWHTLATTSQQQHQSYVTSVGVSWSHAGVTNNKLVRMINGNRRQGYNIGMWNCRRGLIEGEKNSSTKFVEVTHFLQSKKLHILCLIEADLHGATSRYKRRHPLTTKDINDNLGVPGYKLLLPKTWEVHGQARIMIIAKGNLQMKKPEIVWFLTQGGVPPPPPLLRFGTFPFFSYDFFIALK